MEQPGAQDASSLDVQKLTGRGGPYELGEADVNGVRLPVFVNAPANLRTLYQQALTYGDRDFYVYESERYTFAEAWDQASQVAASLSAMGVRQGDRVGIAMRNYPEWIFAFMGVTSLGAIAVAMNAWWTGEEMRYAIEDSGLTTIFVDRERLEHLGPYLDEVDIDIVAVRTEHTSGRGGATSCRLRKLPCRTLSSIRRIPLPLSTHQAPRRILRVCCRAIERLFTRYLAGKLPWRCGVPVPAPGRTPMRRPRR